MVDDDKDSGNYKYELVMNFCTAAFLGMILGLNAFLLQPVADQHISIETALRQLVGIVMVGKVQVVTVNGVCV